MSDRGGWYPYLKCARCSHLGQSHGSNGECMAVVPSHNRKKGMVQCSCRGFIMPVDPDVSDRGIFQINMGGGRVARP